MRIPGLSLIILPAVLDILQCTQLTSSLENLSKCQIPPELVKMCSCGQSSGGLIVTCSSLNSTSDLMFLEPHIASSVRKLEISDSSIPCLDLEDLTPLTKVEVVRVTNCNMRDAVCQKSKMRANHPAQTHKLLPHLKYLDLSHNRLVKLDESLTVLHKLRMINVSNNLITSVNPIFSAFKYLVSLDISHNKLS